MPTKPLFSFAKIHSVASSATLVNLVSSETQFITLQRPFGAQCSQTDPAASCRFQENTYIGSLCVSHHNILLFRFLISSHLFLLHGRIDHLSDKCGDLIVSVVAHSENTMVIQKSVASNEVSTGYVYQPNAQDQVGVVSSNGLDQYFYTSAPTQKPEKKPEAFVFNFAKGSMPTVHIHPKP
ncbi:hypothetical protein GCK72_021969 [Caenorhabditis remanei]|uniref:Uncharacterized protein n=1 Tax=Caenorhabditis remanei TaxID=31234 RepID=A0A6A5GJG0_CAERE|nr:hypothetical protein GCK72_021969 [Caenorhabditis remanei]KAF1755400.1 hypothetical protein GCK72_021969 [Caenorhabditis remanei]